MTAQLLASELTTLLQDSKRKNPELRAATERSLSDLNALPRTSEAQIVADLKSRPLFVKPFLLACSTRNPKFCGNAVACLQRLIVANALPTDTLSDVLNALRDCSGLGLDIQLKVLQALPSLLQNYSDSLTGQLLTAAFQVCFLLYGSQTPVVTNLAAAALQQLINTTYDKAASDQGAYSQDVPTSEVSLGDSTLPIQGSRLDAYKVLDDVCLLTEGHKPKYIQGATLGQNFGLELIESILASHAGSLLARPEQLHTLQIRLMPFLTRQLSEKSSFAATVRTIRVARLVLANFLAALDSQCETLLSLLNHLLDQDSAPLWKRALCLELYKTFHADTTLVNKMYARFDEADERRNIIRDHLGSLARLASEKPATIGLGSQSSTPHVPVDDSGEQAALQAGGLVGSIGASVASIDLNTPGISTHWSRTKTPLMEQLDKQEPSPIPATYIYSLTLACLTAFEEGLAKFLMPFTVPSEKKVKRKSAKSQMTPQDAGSQDESGPRTVSGKITQRRNPVNPLSLTGHPLYRDIEIASHMIDQCWPALLAGSSTFLNASLDNENFHALIRSFQKFTQIAGLLGFSTPRDAFLTTLGKHALPSSRVTKTAPTPKLNDREETPPEGGSSRDTSPAPSISSIRKPESSGDSSTPIVGARHLLCLRALLNLGIALGPVLHRSWSIIFETLQQADLLASVQGLGQKSKSPRQRSNSAGRDEIGGATSDYLRAEITAVDTASSRLFESTADLDDVAFLDVLESLCALLPQIDPIDTPTTANMTLSPNPLRKHQKLRSVSGTAVEGMTSRHEGVFALDKVKDIIRCNIERFIQVDDSNSGWNLLSTKLMAILGSDTDNSKLRFEAARALNDLLVLTVVNDSSSSQEGWQSTRARSLSALLAEVQTLHQKSSHATRFSEQCGIDIHRSALDGLRAILEHCGDSLSLGWSDVLAIMSSVFEASSPDRKIQPRSPILVRSSFGSLELICTDFLSSVPHSSLLQLLDTLYYFSEQDLDLNISLTTATFFRLLSDYLLRDENELFLENVHVEEIPPLGMNDSAAPFISHKVPVLWLSLLNRLVGITADSRIEVRHSALHTIFRILDAQGDVLSNKSFVKIHEATLRPLLQASLNQASSKSDDASDEMPSELFLPDWSKTAVMIVDSVSSLISQWLDMYKHDNHLFDVLEQILGLFTSYLNRKINRLSKAVFGGLSKILSEIDVSSNHTFPLLGSTWSIWSTHHPEDHTSADGRVGDNNDALLAYLFCLGQLLRLTGQDLEGATAAIVVNRLRSCTTDATASAYSTDIESMTPVQKAVIESLKMLPYIDSTTDLTIVKLISEFINLPYQSTLDEGPPYHSFVALSKASMTALEDLVGDRGKRNLTTAESGTPLIAFFALHRSIDLKYRWKRVGREPLTWKKATTTAIAVLQLHIPLFKRPSPALQEYWEEVVSITNVIVSADCKACQNKASIPSDEEFDIKAFSRIKDLLIPVLGSSDLTDELRTRFSQCIYQGSLIHEPNPDDLAWPGEGLLDGLKRDHFGRVKALPPSPRAKMGYLLLDELFDLVADHGSSNEQTNGHNPGDRRRLATAAAPYLILRIGLTLKMYIHDQPMRGRMPQPWSQKKEMLYILRKMVELKMEPSALGGEGMKPELMQRKHLLRLYPLLLKALEAARMDEEMMQAIRGVLGAVEEFSQI